MQNYKRPATSSFTHLCIISATLCTFVQRKFHLLQWNWIVTTAQSFMQTHQINKIKYVGQSCCNVAQPLLWGDVTEANLLLPIKTATLREARRTVSGRIHADRGGNRASSLYCQAKHYTNTSSDKVPVQYLTHETHKYEKGRGSRGQQRLHLDGFLKHHSHMSQI